MNLLKTLFGGRAHADQALSSSHNWSGQSGKEYQFEIHPFDATFRMLPGVYIYAKQLADGDWAPIYISQTRDLHQRLGIREALSGDALHFSSITIVR